MCGICGILGTTETGRIAPMLAAMAHRGPNGDGTYTSPRHPAVLGHKRLAIIDPAGGAQPMANEDNTIFVTFNGCIYNYLELGQHLRMKGHQFASYSDTEVIVHAYEEYGERCVEKFVGMFAFAIWDEKKQSLFCARDRLGIKPFYYWQGGGKFLFASEIKALTAAGLFLAEPCNDALQEYITFQAPLSDTTLFKGVRRLMPGHTLTVGKDVSVGCPRKYWELDYTPDEGHDEAYYVDHLRMLLSDSVKLHLRSDVALGAHLSGGLDSSTVVCMANEFCSVDEPLHVFNGSFAGGDSYDESRYARIVAESTGSMLHTIRPTAADFQETLFDIVRFMDEPAAGPGVFPQYMVSKCASEHVTVVMGGQGGDEIYAGYARYLVGYLEECLKGAISKTAHTAEYAATLSSIIPSLPLLQAYIPMLRSFWTEGLFESQDKRYLRLMDRSRGAKDLYAGDVLSERGKVENVFFELFNSCTAPSFLNKMLHFDLKVHLPALLHVEDRTSMAWSLESRVPLLDHRLCEFMAQVPVTMKFKNGNPKHLFKKAITNTIPDAVLNREDKMGFPVPLQSWFKGELHGFVADILLDKRTRERGIFNAERIEASIKAEESFGRSIWGALNLELWFRTFIDGNGGNRCDGGQGA